MDDIGDSTLGLCNGNATPTLMRGVNGPLIRVSCSSWFLVLLLLEVTVFKRVGGSLELQTRSTRNGIGPPNLSDELLQKTKDNSFAQFARDERQFVAGVNTL